MSIAGWGLRYIYGVECFVDSIHDEQVGWSNWFGGRRLDLREIEF